MKNSKLLYLLVLPFFLFGCKEPIEKQSQREAHRYKLAAENNQYKRELQKLIYEKEAEADEMTNKLQKEYAQKQRKSLFTLLSFVIFIIAIGVLIYQHMIKTFRVIEIKEKEETRRTAILKITANFDKLSPEQIDSFFAILMLSDGSDVKKLEKK